MDNTLPLVFSYLRKESDNSFMLFLKVEPSIFEKDLDISLTDNKELSISIPGEQTLVSTVLPEELYYNLSNQLTSTIFLDESGEVLGKHNLQPLKPEIKSSRKPR